MLDHDKVLVVKAKKASEKFQGKRLHSDRKIEAIGVLQFDDKKSPAKHITRSKKKA